MREASIAASPQRTSRQSTSQEGTSAHRPSPFRPSVRGRIAAWIAALFLAAAPAAAQTPNLALFQEMAVSCLGELPPSVKSVVLDAPDEMPYVRSALIAAWRDDGRQVYLADAPGTRLAYAIEEATVTYARQERGLSREVRLTLAYTMTGDDGRVVADERCASQRVGTLDAEDLDVVENEAFPETQADLPRAGWGRRLLEPAVLTAAAGVAVFLFFSLRSGGGDGA